MKRRGLIPAILMLAGLVSSCSTSHSSQPSISVLRDGARLDCSSDTTAPCTLLGGHDVIRVQTTYDGLDFDRDDLPDAPTLSILLDGTAVETPPTMTGSFDDAGALVFTSGDYRVPAKALSSIAFKVDGGSGYTSQLDQFRVTVDAPTVAVSGGCTADAPCMAGVGATYLDASAWVDEATTFSVRSRIDGRPGDTIEGELSGADDQPRTGSVKLDVPDIFVASGSTVEWDLRPSVGAVSLPTINLAIAPLVFQARVLECDRQLCEREAKSKIHVEISAPSGLRDTTGTVQIRLDGAPDGDPLDVDLDELDGDSRLGVATATLPATPGEVQIRVRLGAGYVVKLPLTSVPPAPPKRPASATSGEMDP